MAWRPHGRVRVSSRRPEAAGICDRCGFAYNHNRLTWQYQWAGERLQNLRMLVCDRCLDVPQEQLRARILLPDPVPIQNPRPEPFAPTGINDEQTNYLTAVLLTSPPNSQAVGYALVTEDGIILVTEGSFTG